MTPGRTLVGPTLRDGFGLRRPHFRRRRKQVGRWLRRTTGRHGATLRPAAHRGNGLGEKENQVLFTPTGYRRLDSDLSDISPIWDSLESFSFSWRASFCPRLGSCCFFLPEPSFLRRDCLAGMAASEMFTSQESNADRYGFVAARSARTAHERTAIPEVDYRVSSGRVGRAKVPAGKARRTTAAKTCSRAWR